MLVCPLCKKNNTGDFGRDRHRQFWHCRDCQLVFVGVDEFLSDEAEKAEYDLHRNRVDDPGYRKFLGRLFRPLVERLAPGSRGLEFGCGPGPALAAMFTEIGMVMTLYDHFYAPAHNVFDNRYDFITATEVVEHLHEPQRELDGLWGCLQPGGWLGVMTKLVIDRDAFFRWHYKNDLTHVCFFSRQTFKWLSRRWQAELIFIDQDVMLFRKKT